jgi:hypothetical protein
VERMAEILNNRSKVKEQDVNMAEMLREMESIKGTLLH